MTPTILEKMSRLLGYKEINLLFSNSEILIQLWKEDHTIHDHEDIQTILHNDELMKEMMELVLLCKKN